MKEENLKKKNRVLKRPKHSSLAVPLETLPVAFLVQKRDRFR